jgi:hypothetical protein
LFIKAFCAREVEEEVGGRRSFFINFELLELFDKF